MKVKEIIKKIEAAGWVYTRMNGSHRIFKRPNTPQNVAVAGKPSDDLDAGTENKILKDAGLK